MIQSATADDAAAQRFKSVIQNKLVMGNALSITGMVLGLRSLFDLLNFAHLEGSSKGIYLNHRD